MGAAGQARGWGGPGEGGLQAFEAAQGVNWDREAAPGVHTHAQTQDRSPFFLACIPPARP